MLAFLLIFVSGVLADPGQEKLEQIRALEAKSSHGIIQFDQNTYL